MGTNPTGTCILQGVQCRVWGLGSCPCSAPRWWDLSLLWASVSPFAIWVGIHLPPGQRWVKDTTDPDLLPISTATVTVIGPADLFL